MKWLCLMLVSSVAFAAGNLPYSASSSQPKFNVLGTKGTLYTHNGTNDYGLAPGADTQCLQADSTATSGLVWGACALGAGGAPSTAQYWTGAADGTLSAEKNLGALGTGLVINTAGVPSAYAGSTCGANSYAASTNASGALTCTQPAFSNLSGSATDSQIPDNITVTLAATATSLAADPADCAAGQYATTIGATGALVCAQPAFTQLSGQATIAQLPADSGAANSKTFLRGDGVWASPFVAVFPPVKPNPFLQKCNAVRKFNCRTN